MRYWAFGIRCIRWLCAIDRLGWCFRLEFVFMVHLRFILANLHPKGLIPSPRAVVICEFFLVFWRYANFYEPAQSPFHTLESKLCLARHIPKITYVLPHGGALGNCMKPTRFILKYRVSFDSPFEKKRFLSNTWTGTLLYLFDLTCHNEVFSVSGVLIDCVASCQRIDFCSHL